MEILIAYKQSKTIDKSLSYLSGVGEDLSFNISYFVSLSKYGARYLEQPIYLSESKYIFITDRVDFGEARHDGVSCASHQDFINQQRIMPVRFENVIAHAFRYRLSEITTEQFFNFLDTKKYLDCRSDFFFGDLKRINGIYTSNQLRAYRSLYGSSVNKDMPAEIADKNDIPDCGTPLFIYQPKPGSSLYKTEKQISSTSIQKMHENELIVTDKYDEREVEISEAITTQNQIKTLFEEDFNFLSTQSITIYINKFKNAKVQQPKINMLTGNDDVSIEDREILFDSHRFNYEIEEKAISNSDQESISTPQKTSLTNNYFENVNTDTQEVLTHDNLHIGTPRKQALTTNNFTVGKFRSGADFFTKLYLVSQGSNAIFTHETDLCLGLSSKRLNTNNVTISVGGNAQEITAEDTAGNQVSTNELMLRDLKDNIFSLSKHDKMLLRTDSYRYLDKQKKQTFGKDTLLNLNKCDHEASYAYTEALPADKDIKGKFELEASYVSKHDKEYFQFGTDSVFKENTRDIYQSQILSTTKNTLGIASSLSFAFLTKNSKGIAQMASMQLHRVMSNSLAQEPAINVSKNSKAISPNTDFDSVFRNLPYSIGTFDFSKFLSKNNRSIGDADAIVSFEKESHITGIEVTDKLFKKEFTNTHINQLVGGANKKLYNTSVIEHYDALAKGFRETNIHAKSPFVNKNYKPTSLRIFAYSISKKEYLIDEKRTYLFYTLPKREYRVFTESLLLKKNQKKTSLNHWLVNLKPSYKNTDIVDLMEHFKKEYYFDYHKNIWVWSPAFGGVMGNEPLPVKTKPNIDTTISPNILASKPTRDTALDRCSGFGYIEKTDYVKIKDERTDELLLPASDFNYETFAEKLIRDGNVDVRYIKRIDDNGNMYINIPVENPIRHYADLATQYVDLNVGMLIYIIEKAYNIWQNNIFVYSAMSSDGALNDILKKLKQNLFIQYPSEADQYNLHRAIRLFRWYAEMSILNNAEYMLKLRYEDVEVDYANKDLSSFSEIAVFENLAINSSYVLTSIDISKTSKLAVRVNRTHKVRLSSLAAVSGGTLVINDNGNIETFTDQMVEFDKELDVGENELTFEFTPTSSTAYFGLMKLKVTNYNIVSYDVEYVGKIGESNPTINHLITMLSVCGDSIDTIQRMVTHATPQTNALDQMRVYFNLHHEEKLKGKRLTIKK